MPHSSRWKFIRIVWLLLIIGAMTVNVTAFVKATDEGDDRVPLHTPAVSPEPTGTQVVPAAESEPAFEQAYGTITPITMTHTPLTDRSDEKEVPSDVLRVYLPVILKPQSPRFVHMGMHLGSRPGIRWDDIPDDGEDPGGYDFLELLRGNTPDGHWPAVVVVLSDQVFKIERGEEEPCNMQTVEVTEATATVGREHVFRFMAQATRMVGTGTGESTKVLIRIAPSPGNFADADVEIPFTDSEVRPHELSDADVRAPAESSSYCTAGGDNPAVRARDVSDIVAEMNIIMEIIEQWNSDHPDEYMKKENVFFIPANEPNIEWYTEGSDDPFENRINPEVWEQMDAYFEALYNHPTRADNVQILTPAMAPWAYAEHFDSGCTPVELEGSNAGYDLMPATYDTGNDGYVWNNYWNLGLEEWGDGDPCPEVRELPDSHHMIQFFPETLQEKIRTQGKPIFISEGSQRLDDESVNDGLVPSKDDRSSQISNSTRRFVAEESEPGNGAQYVALWLLSQDLLEQNPEVVKNATSCDDLDYDPPDDPMNPTEEEKAAERAWHMAYLPDATVCRWFEETWR